MDSEKMVTMLSLWILKLVCMLESVTGFKLFEFLEIWEHQTKKNLLLKYSSWLVQLLLNFLGYLNFQFSMVAEPLVGYLRGERTYLIAEARWVSGRRHRIHRGRGWRYSAWLYKLKATNFEPYFIVKRSWFKTLCSEIRYQKENFGVLVTDTVVKKFHVKRHSNNIPFYRLLFATMLCCVVARTSAMPAETPFEAKTFGRPAKFDGTENQWRDWAFAFVAYCMILDTELGRLMTAAQDKEETIDVTIMRPEHAVISQKLYYMLAMLLTHSALTEIRHIPQQNGFEAWRRLTNRFEPKSRNRQLGMLEAALHPNFAGSDEVVRDRILEWEASIDKYETMSGMSLNDDVQIATLIKAASEDHRRYLLQVVL